MKKIAKIFICLSIIISITSCSSWNTIRNTLLGVAIGGGLGYALGGGSGAIKGAVAGAVAGVIMGMVLDEENRSQIQNALELESISKFKDKRSGDEYSVFPKNRFEEDGRECVSFVLVNETKHISKTNNAACRGSKNRFEFRAINDTLQPPPIKRS